VGWAWFSQLRFGCRALGHDPRLISWTDVALARSFSRFPPARRDSRHYRSMKWLPFWRA
jgi:hypothetical protein